MSPLILQTGVSIDGYVAALDRSRVGDDARGQPGFAKGDDLPQEEARTWPST